MPPQPPPALNNKQKRALAAVLLTEVDSLLEFWDEKTAEKLGGVTAEAAAAQLSLWLSDLPGDTWPSSLPDPYQIRRDRRRHRKDHGS